LYYFGKQVLNTNYVYFVKTLNYNNKKSIKMKGHVGSSIDRLLRIILGLVIAILGVIFDSWWGLIGIIPLATGIFKWCPLYFLLGMSTAEKKEK